MSNFEPSSSDRLSGDGEQAAAITDFDMRVAQSLLKLTNSLRIPKDTLGYLVEYLALNQPSIPVGQLSGFNQFTVQPSDRLVGDTDITSTTFADPAVGVAGPEITGLPPGKYLIVFGARLVAAAAANLFVGVKVNTTEPIDDDSIVTSTTSSHPGITAIVKTLSLDSNTLRMRFRTTSGTANAKYRWMIAIKSAEL